MSCMAHFEAGGLYFNGISSFIAASKSLPDGNIPLNCSEKPFCNIRNRFEEERTFADFSARSTIIFHV